MPDPAPSKRRIEVGERLERRSGVRYAELHCKSNFSFLRGASHPDELVAQAAALGYEALAITDRHSLAGIVRAHGAAKEAGLKLIVGAEIVPGDGPPLVLLATDRASYGRLCRLLTCGKRRTTKGNCELQWVDLLEYSAGLIALVQLSLRSEPLQPPPAPDAIAMRQIGAQLNALREVAEEVYGLAELARGPDDAAELAEQQQRARRWRLPLVAGNDVHYHVDQRRALHDVLVCIREGCTITEAGYQLFANGERHLQLPEEMAYRFAGVPDAVRRTVEIADRCQFSLDSLRYEYPEELAPVGQTPLEYLRQLTWEGARHRYPDGVPEKVRQLVEHELNLIGQLHYEAYFLTVWDLVRFARSRNILCQGRGSAANSAVCFCLGVTSVDPAQLDVLFERFISAERNEAPDIDVDFEHERREEVLQYIYTKYGRERAGMTAEVITYRPRSALRDVGKALGIPAEKIDALAKSFDGYHHKVEPNVDPWSTRCQEVGIDAEDRLVRQWRALMETLLGFPRHLSQHVGGMVMTQGALCELVPIENAVMADRTVIEWDKDDLDTLGILKVDCLALGMLTAIHKAFDLIQLHTGRAYTLATIGSDDPRVYEMVSRADTMGVFQIESRAQMSMLPRLRPACFYDLVIEVAIVRPGPIQGDMVHPYLRRRNGEEAVEYPNDAIRAVLEKTLGVPIFQEQAMRLAVVAAGFTPGEADQLRRAMGAWRRPGIIDRFRQKLIAGMQASGLSGDYAERVFKQISGFGEYGFPESHAASFALLVYVSAWLKCYHPAAFCAALINSQPMGFYAPAQLLRDARLHGVRILPLDVNHSHWDCTLEPVEQASGETADDRGRALAIRLGFRLVKGLPRAALERLVAEREQGGAFRSQGELARRSGLTQAVLLRLGEADAFGSLTLDRRAAVWQALAAPPHHRRPLLALGDEDSDEELRPQGLPGLSPFDEVLADYRTTGISLKGHPIGFFRAGLTARRIVPAEALEKMPDGRFLRVAGLVLLRQRPSTAKGITFVTLEDETGVANLVVHAHIWKRFHQVAMRATSLVAHGRLERQGQVIHVVVHRLEDFAELTRRIASQSRDFR